MQNTRTENEISTKPFPTGNSPLDRDNEKLITILKRKCELYEEQIEILENMLAAKKD